MYFNWIAQERELSAAALTVRVQTLSPNDNGRLLYDAFFPRRDVDSVKLKNITTLDFRPVADRREWNTRGRLIPLRTPNAEDVEMIPVESYFKLAEREIQELEERTFGNQDVFRQIVGVDVPSRVDGLATANYRRLEVDAFSVWALNQMQVRNPQTGDTYTFGFNVEAGRYETAGAAWGANAYNEFIAWLEAASEKVGPIQGAMLRQKVLAAIRSSAPNPYSPDSTIEMTTEQLERRISDVIGTPFRFYRNEATADTFTGAGVETQRVKLWPMGTIAAVPAGEEVGFTAFAPVARAMQLARENGGAASGIDVRGMTAFHEVANAGRELTVEVQANAAPMIDERRVAVIDTLIR